MAGFFGGLLSTISSNMDKGGVHDKVEEEEKKKKKKDEIGLEHQEQHRHHHSNEKVEKIIGTFWDIENCSVPSGKSALNVAQKIRSMDFYKDHHEMEFLVVCDVFKIPVGISDDLNLAQVSVHHVSCKNKNAADDRIKVLMRKFVDNFSSPSRKMRIVLITGDKDFLSDISDYRLRKGIEIVLLYSSNAIDHLINAAHINYQFHSLLEDIAVSSNSESSSSSKPSSRGYTEIVVGNLPRHVPDDIIRNRLNMLVRKADGKVIKINNDGTALLKFDDEEKTTKSFNLYLKNEDVYGNRIHVEYNKRFHKPHRSPSTGRRWRRESSSSPNRSSPPFRNKPTSSVAPLRRHRRLSNSSKDSRSGDEDVNASRFRPNNAVKDENQDQVLTLGEDEDEDNYRNDWKATSLRSTPVFSPEPISNNFAVLTIPKDFIELEICGFSVINPTDMILIRKKCEKLLLELDEFNSVPELEMIDSNSYLTGLKLMVNDFATAQKIVQKIRGHNVTNFIKLDVRFLCGEEKVSEYIWLLGEQGGRMKFDDFKDLYHAVFGCQVILSDIASCVSSLDILIVNEDGIIYLESDNYVKEHSNIPTTPKKRIIMNNSDKLISSYSPKKIRPIAAHPKIFISLNELNERIEKAFALSLNNELLVEQFFRNLPDVIDNQSGVPLDLLLLALNSEFDRNIIIQHDSIIRREFKYPSNHGKPIKSDGIKKLEKEFLELLNKANDRRIKIRELKRIYLKTFVKNLNYNALSIEEDENSSNFLQPLVSDDSPFIIIGRGNERELTTSWPYIVKLFALNLREILLNSSKLKIVIDESTFPNLFKCEITNYGVCYLNDLVDSSLIPKNVFSFNKQTNEASLSTYLTTFINNAISIIIETPRFEMSVSKFDSSYSEKYGNYSAVDLYFKDSIDLFRQCRNFFSYNGSNDILTLSNTKLREYRLKKVKGELEKNASLEITSHDWDSLIKDIDPSLTMKEVADSSDNLLLMESGSKNGGKTLLTLNEREESYAFWSSKSASTRNFTKKIVEILFTMNRPVFLQELQQKFNEKKNSSEGDDDDDNMEENTDHITFNKTIVSMNLVQEGFLTYENDLIDLTPKSIAIMEISRTLSIDGAGDLTLLELEEKILEGKLKIPSNYSNIKQLIKESSPMFFRIKKKSVFLARVYERLIGTNRSLNLSSNSSSSSIASSSITTKKRSSKIAANFNLE